MIILEDRKRARHLGIDVVVIPSNQVEVGYVPVLGETLLTFLGVVRLVGSRA